MNKLLRTLCLTVTLAAAGSTFAQSATPLVDQREAYQQQRIAKGVVTPAKRHQPAHTQNHASHHIAKQKHDHQHLH
jgi:hypothetical protein